MEIPRAFSAALSRPNRGRRQNRDPSSSIMVPATASAASAKRKRRRRLTAKQLQAFLLKEQDDSQLYNLTLDLNDLRQQVQDLQMQRRVCETRSLVARQNFNGAVMQTLDHFFFLFRHGYDDFAPQDRAFFQACMDENLAMGTTASGLELFFEQWRRYTKAVRMEAFVIESTNLVISDGDVCFLECTGHIRGKLTRPLIETVFPHVLSDEALVAKLVGRSIWCPTRTGIYVDTAGRIVQYDAHVDWFHVLNELLASTPQDVIMMLSNAKITAEGSMIPDPEAPDESFPIVFPENSQLESDDDVSTTTTRSKNDRHSVEFLLS